MAYSGSELSEVLGSESELIEDGQAGKAQSHNRPKLLSDSEEENNDEAMDSEILPVDASQSVFNDHEGDENETEAEAEAHLVEGSSQYSEDGDESIVSGTSIDTTHEDVQKDDQAGLETLNYVLPKQTEVEGSKRKFLGKIPSFKRSLRRFSSAQDLRTDGEEDNSLEESIKLSKRRKSFSFFKSDSLRSSATRSKRKKMKLLSASVVRYFKSRKRDTKSTVKKNEEDLEAEGEAAEEKLPGTPKQRPSLQRKLSFSGGAKSLLRKLSSARILRMPGKLKGDKSGIGKERDGDCGDGEEEGYTSESSSLEVTGFEHLFYAQTLQRLVKTWKSPVSLLEKLVAALAPLGMLVTLLAKLARDIEARFSQDNEKQERAFYAACGTMYMGSTVEKATLLYSLCDVDRDGTVSKSDFKKVLTEIAWSDTTPLLSLKENQPNIPNDEAARRTVLETKLNVFYILNDPLEIRRLGKTLRKYKWNDTEIFAALSRKYVDGKSLQPMDPQKLQDVAFSVKLALEGMVKDGESVSFQDYLRWISEDPTVFDSINHGRSKAKEDWFSLCPEPIWDYPVQDLEKHPVRVCSSRASSVKKISSLSFRRRNIDVRDGTAIISKGDKELFRLDLLDQSVEIELIARPGHRHPETIYLRCGKAELFLQTSSTALQISTQEVLRILKVNTHAAYLPRDYSDYSDGSYESSEQ